MKVSELIEALSYYNGDDDITFYFLKNDTLTNCQVEDISFYTDTMGVESVSYTHLTLPTTPYV